jgi:hypothetical protein
MLSHSDVDLETIGEKPTALFIVIQDEKKTYHPLVTILLKQCYETLIATAQKHGGQLPVRTNFLLDEFANMPPLKDVTTMITAARSRHIRFTMIIQNFAQLDQVYGKENADTIKGNCGNIIYLITTELKALEEISKMCGEVKSKKDDKTASTPLVTISDLQKMKQFEVIIMRLRLYPFKTKFTPYFKWDTKRYSEAEYPHREKNEVSIFDLREFVKEKKKEKLMQMMNDPSAAAANGGMPNGMFGAMPNPMARNTNGMMGGMMNPNPINMNAFGNNEVSQTNKPNNMMGGSSLNVDDIIKKIDAKIAEIEKEEQKQQETNIKPLVENKPLDTAKLTDSKEISNTESLTNNTIGKEEIKENKVEEKKSISTDDLLRTNSVDNKESNKIENKKIEVKEENKPIIHEDKIPTTYDISDDQFFDDFFDD